MKIELGQGESLTVTLQGSDGEFTISFGPEKLAIITEWPDASGRVGVIYEETFGVHDPEAPKDVQVPAWAASKPGLVLYPEDKKKFLDCLAEQSLSMSASEIKDDTTFLDLGYDSMDMADVESHLEDLFNISLVGADHSEASFRTVRDLENKVAERLLNANR